MTKASSKPAVKRQRPPTPPAPKAFLEAKGGATRMPAPVSEVGPRERVAPKGGRRRGSRTPPPKVA
eukprot:5696479-Lingulodinium_polyedra.AAC.1